MDQGRVMDYDMGYNVGFGDGEQNGVRWAMEQVEKVLEGAFLTNEERRGILMVQTRLERESKKV